MMQTPRYAVVSYIDDPVGEFVEQLRRELHPDLPHMASHLSLLPPRCLQGSESSAVRTIAEICSQAHAAARMRELHRRLNTQALAAEEQWPYMPHLTIAKLGAEHQAQGAYHIARQRWAEFEGSRCIQVKKLTFVREEGQNRWVDLVPVDLGQRLVRG